MEDLPALQGLWQGAGLPWDELEKFITEFQVVPGEEGVLLGAVGMLVDGNQALLHSEAVRASDDDDGDELRAALWRRIQIVARNQGVHRIWTQEDAPYWLASGFLPAPAADVASGGASFLDTTAEWSFFQLIDPSKAESLVQEQMAVWQATRTREAEEFQGKVKIFRGVAFLAFGIVVAALLALLFMVVKAKPGAFGRIFQ